MGAVTADFRLGPWRVEPGLNRISCNGSSLRLEPKVMEVLVCLAHHAGETLSKEHLLSAVWADTFVSDDVLTRSVSELRRVLEDDPKEPRYIQTIPKRGYRMVAPVEMVNGGSTPGSVAAAHSVEAQNMVAPRPSRWMWPLALAGITILLLGPLAAFNPDSVRARFWGAGSNPQIRSLAVLPLKNLSGDPSQEYFADGMTDELITYLSQISGLRVISYTSTYRYKLTKKTMPEIARELGVDGVVEGSVQRGGERVRVNAQLIYAPQETHVWAQSFDGNFQDALTVQSTLADAIAEQVKIKLTPAQKARLQAQRPVNLEALEAYLQGDYHLAKVGHRDKEGEARKAIAYFQEAIKEAPDFAAAYVKICQVYEVQAVIFSRAERWPMERAAAQKAVALDPNLSSAHLAVGEVKLQNDWDFPTAEAEFKKAVELDPNSAPAHDGLGDFFDITNHPDEGLREHLRAQELDPGNDHLSNNFYRSGQYDRAIELAKQRLELHPDDGVAHWSLFHNYGQLGMQKESIEQFIETANIFGYELAALAVNRTYTTSGKHAAMLEAARQMARYYGLGQFDRPGQVAIQYGRLGDKDQALAWLQKAFSVRDPEVVFMNCEPAFDFLRSDYRFQDLKRRVGLSTL